MKESQSALQERVQKIISLLQKTYPDVRCELDFANPLELLIATILSARCTDKQVNKVTQNLFKKYHSASDYAQISLAELEEDLKSLGLFRNKAKNIQACCRTLVEKHGGTVPSNMEALIQLDGVGRKTANVVLGNAFNITSGVVVDTHVGRLSKLLGLSEQDDPAKIEADLQALVPKDQWILFSHWLIWHGRRRCPSRNPDCATCEIQSLCPSRKKE